MAVDPSFGKLRLTGSRLLQGDSSSCIRKGHSGAPVVHVTKSNAHSTYINLSTIVRRNRARPRK